MHPFAVLDFETTGMSPAHGCRATEIGVVIWHNGQIVDRFQSLMNAGVRIPSMIVQLTGISNAMLAEAPPAAEVMRQAADFVGDLPIAAHNASFDRKFWCDELARIGRPADQTFVCTMLLARRLLPGAPNHKLGTLARYLDLPDTGRAHRALADAEMAAMLLGHMQQQLATRHGIDADAPLLARLGRVPAAGVATWLKDSCR